MGHVLDDWFLEIITGSWRLEPVPGGYLLVPGGYNRLLEVINRFLEVINRFLEVIPGSWGL